MTTKQTVDVEREVAELLPCPFCGSQPNSVPVGDDDGGYWAIECPSCHGGADHPFCGVHTDSKIEATASWNHRAALAATPDLQPPAGCALVPIEPTPEMVEALRKQIVCGIVAAHTAYRTMLAAAPRAPIAQPLSEQDLAILEAVRRELGGSNGRGNAPGHGHSVIGIWDSDNGAKSGEPCAWCLTWQKFTALIDAHGIKGEVKS